MYWFCITTDESDSFAQVFDWLIELSLSFVIGQSAYVLVLFSTENRPVRHTQVRTVAIPDDLVFHECPNLLGYRKSAAKKQ